MAKDVEGQAFIFPELDSSPAHKNILKLAKKLKKVRDMRKEALNESKAEEDKTQESLVGAMHEAGLTAFKHDSIEVKIKPKSEKVTVKMVADDDDDDAADDAEED